MRTGAERWEAVGTEAGGKTCKLGQSPDNRMPQQDAGEELGDDTIRFVLQKDASSYNEKNQLERGTLE